MGYFDSASKNAAVPLTEEEIKKILMKPDVNNDKSLSWDELRKAFDDMGSYLPGIRAQIALWRADDNGYAKIDISELPQLLNYASGLWPHYYQQNSTPAA